MTFHGVGGVKSLLQILICPCNIGCFARMLRPTRRMRVALEAPVNPALVLHHQAANTALVTQDLMENWTCRHAGRPRAYLAAFHPALRPEVKAQPK